MKDQKQQRKEAAQGAPEERFATQSGKQKSGGGDSPDPRRERSHLESRRSGEDNPDIPPEEKPQ